MNRQFDNRFDELFNEKFRDFKVNPPDNILSNVKASVENPSFFKKIGRFTQDNFLVISIAVLIPAMIIGVYSFTGKSTNTDSKGKNINFIQKDNRIGENTQTATRSETPVKNEPATINKNVNKTNIISTVEAETCGLTYNLNAKSSKGKWLSYSAHGVSFSSDSDPKAMITVPKEGEYLISWTPEQGGAPENIKVKFNKVPVRQKARDTVVCSNEIDLRTCNNSQNGSWNKIKDVQFSDIHNARAHAKYTGSGTLHFIWTDNGKCSVNDTLKVLFAEKPAADIIVKPADVCFGSPVTLSAKDQNLARYEWALDNGVAADNSKSTVSVTWNKGLKHDVLLKAWNKYNCVSASTASVELSAPIDVKFDVIPAKCSNNGSVLAKPTMTNAKYRYFWMNEKKASENSRKNLAPGIYEIVVSDTKNCRKSYNVEVPGSGVVNADFYHSNYEQNPPSTVYFVNTSTIDKAMYNPEDVKFDWDFGDGQKSDEESPKHVYTNTGDYRVRLTMTHKSGCSDSYIVGDISINSSSEGFPNVFSPNGDGQNDVFKVPSAGLYNFQVIITNSKGDEIYKWSDPDGVWDGRLKGGSLASPGAYFYHVTGNYKDGKPYRSDGPVQLVRD
ncbi:MAG: PKD domain-containing protein [Bacteroidia bacterium]|nr:PKD domain-containing protein [Bacteroidia bacterium]